MEGERQRQKDRGTHSEKAMRDKETENRQTETEKTTRGEMRQRLTQMQRAEGQRDTHTEAATKGQTSTLPALLPTSQTHLEHGGCAGDCGPRLGPGGRRPGARVGPLVLVVPGPGSSG